ncbi:MAG: LuxR C-terminal-related transcriptional regulator, partial [Humibacter sp.]
LPRVTRELILKHSEGNPLALLELGKVARDLPGSLSDPAGYLPLSQRLKRSFLARVVGLPAATKQALLLLALDGREDLRLVADLGLHIGDLEAAEQTGLIEIDPARWLIRFTHPLIRDALVEDATGPERRQAHLQLAEATRTEPIRRAWHLADAAVEVDADTSDLLELSAHSALSRGDVYGAARALARSAQLTPSVDDRRRRLAQAAYFEAEVIGEPEGAARHLQDLQNLQPEDVETLSAVVAAAVVYADLGGDCGAANKMISRAINSDAYGWSANNQELIEAFFAWFVLCWQAGVKELWEDYFQALARIDPECPPILSVLSRAFADPLAFGPGVRTELQALIAQHLDDRDPMTINRLATGAVYVDLLADARPAIWRLIEGGRHGSGFRSYFRALMTECLDDFIGGRWDRGRELADEGLAAARGTALTASWYFVYAEALFAAGRGEVANATRWCEELERDTLARKAYGIHSFSHHVRTLIAAAQEDWEGAYQHAIALAPVGEFPPFAPHAMWVAFDLVEAALRTGRREDAQVHADAMRRRNLADVSPRIALLVAGARGMTEASDTGTGILEDALRSSDATAWPFDYARVQLVYGARLRRELRLKDARMVLREALMTFESLEAEPWAMRTRTELAAARDRRNAHIARQSPLTPQEQSIAELAAAGLSNKDIGAQLYLSPRTVGGHLYRIYPKLGIASRAALRDALSNIHTAQGRDVPPSNEPGTDLPGAAV